MGSFSAVNNFRAALSGRWRHVSYQFFPYEYFQYQLAEKLSLRFSTTYLVSRLGIYFSHFIFVAAPAWSVSGFFLDMALDRRYKRFLSPVLRIYKFKSVKPLYPIGHYSRRYLLKINIRTCIGKLHSRIWCSFKFNFHKNIFNSPFCKFSKCNFRYLTKFANTRQIWFRTLCIEALLGLRHFFFIRKKRKSVVSVFSFGEKFQFLNSRQPCYWQYFSKNKRKIFGSNLYKILPNFYLRSALKRRLYKAPDWKRLVTWLAKFENLFVRPVSKIFFPTSFLTQFRVRFAGFLKFFLSYYFRYYPVRFLQILKTRNFLFFRRSTKVFLNLGFKFRWLRFGVRTISRWFFKVNYSFFFRYPLFFLLGQNLKAMSFKFNTDNFKPLIQLFNLSNFGVLPSDLVSSIFAKRLRRRERVNPILYSLIRLVLMRRKVLGLVILRSGRFTKRQRTTRMPYRVGRVSYNSYVMPIDYSLSVAILKYSMVAIKVWISTAPGISFFRQKLIGDGGGLIYPSSLIKVFNLKYLYVWSTINLFKYFHSIKIRYTTFNSSSKQPFMFRSKFNFLSSWNFPYIRAYRRFAKSFVFSKYNYMKKIRSILLE